jgi:hypothetical protein
LQHLARAGRRTDAGRLGEHGGFEIFGDFLPFYFGIAVEDYVAEIRKELCGAVAAARETEKLRGIVEERRGDFAGAEFRMIDDVFDERRGFGIRARRGPCGDRLRGDFCPMR